MCVDPVTLTALSAVASMAGTGVNYLANQQMEDARAGAIAAERTRQAALDQEAAAINTQSNERFQGFEGKQDERAKTLADMFTAQPAELPATAAPMPPTSSNLVVQAEQKAKGEARDRTNQIGAALGNLRAFGDLFGETSRLQARDATKVGQIGGFKRGSSGVLAGELDAANSAGSGTRMLGDVLGGLGRVGMSAGLTGGGMFGAPVASGVPAANPMAGMAAARAADRASVPGYLTYGKR